MTMSAIGKIRIVEQAVLLMEVARSARADIPRIVSLFGPSGVGKSTAGVHLAARYDAVFVELRSHMTAKSLLKSIATALSYPVGRMNTNELLDAVAAQLADQDRPLILDEFDYAVASTSLVDLVRDIHALTDIPIMVIGEEALPEKLRKWDRFHNRVLKWENAVPLTFDDARIIRDIYCAEDPTTGETPPFVEDDLLNLIHAHVGGITRKIVTNIEEAHNIALTQGRDRVDLQVWGNTPVNDGIFHRGRVS